ncbi:putative nuclease HARBI1 isoform X1 [Neodiprion lecontei]|uniref:Nuclease HARBI1 isoform X1 n=1 Tax=Neodiprion lecontei TaxID=441921 RepID=A0A6J0BKC2_NEOLC|nr:putative nuclease HARBI1 isoform X1 [Neodiprion lecontei]
MAEPVHEVRIIEEIFSSENSDDEEDILLLRNIANRRRKIPRIQNYIADVVNHYNDKQFKSHFRVSRETCNYLIALFEQSEHYPKGPPFGGVRIKTAEEYILCYLWFAGNKSVYRIVAQLFGLSLSTAHAMIESVTTYLTDELGPLVIRFPRTLQEKQDICEEFEEIAGYPGVCGCIDGTFINIRTPAHKIKSTYVNRHDTTALTLQGICDAKKKFLDVFTGIPGKIHDARVFTLSFIRPTVLSMGPDFHILGDSAYPICENLMTPIRDYGNLTDEQREYNRRFCSTRVLIENAFGLLKQRFRQLIRTDMWGVLKTSKFILSCCVMHNLCIERNDFLDGIEHYMAEPEPEAEFIINDEARRLGVLKRNLLSRQFM